MFFKFDRSRVLTVVARLVVVILPTLLAATSDGAIVKKDVTYHLAGRPYEGYLAYDDSIKDRRAGILVTHDWLGVTEKTKAKVDELAGMGYVAFAVDIYGKGVRPQPPEAGATAGHYKKDRIALRARMQQGLKVLRDQPQVDRNRLAVIGYCFGGTAALELARAGADVKAVVSFHGGLDSPKPEDGKRIKGSVLALHGANDPTVPASDLAAFEDELRKAGVDWMLVKFGGAVHSFTDKTAGNDPSKASAYDPKADRRSWAIAQDFLKERL